MYQNKHKNILSSNSFQDCLNSKYNFCLILQYYNNRLMISNLSIPFTTRNPLSNKTISPSMAAKVITITNKLSLPNVASDLQSVILKQASQCTFQPKINPHQKSRRSINKFIEDQEKYQKQKEEKISLLREEKVKTEQQEITLTPMIDSSSRKIVENINNGSNDSIFEKLFREQPRKRSIKQFSFSPKILNRSHSIKRKSDISSLLYSDAKRRQQKSQFMLTTSRQQSDVASPKINTNTNRLVYEKILNQLHQTIKETEVPPLVAIITLEDLFNVELNPNKPENVSNVHKILEFLTSLNHELTEVVIVDKIREFIAIIVEAEINFNYFDKSQRLQIHKNFKYFYKERVKKEKIIQIPQKLPFKPQTLNSSSKLADSYRQKACQQVEGFLQNHKPSVKIQEGQITIQDLFILRHAKKKQQNLQKKIEKQKKQLQQCTFKPKISPLPRPSKHNIEEKKKTKIKLKPAYKQTAKQQGKTCGTEHTEKTVLKEKPNKQNLQLPPKIEKKIPTNRSTTKRQSSTDIDKIILRMSAGRQKRDFQNRITERGYPQNQNWNQLQKRMHRKSVQNLQKIRRLSFKQL